jgi:radical SAM protein with 4Fe4S-binding SPASM domain
VIKKIKNLNKLAKIYFAYKTGKTICNYSPLRIWLEPTDKCNLACPFCINKTMPEEGKGYMEWDLFRKIIDPLENEICDINLFHRGEPLLHPKIIDMVSYCIGKGLNTRIHSNATKLNQESAKALLSCGLNYISFSFDGFDKETYEKNRVNATFENTLNNILNFLKIKKEFDAKTFIVLQIIDTGISKDKKIKEKFLQYFKGLPVDKISIRTPHNWAGGIETKKEKQSKKPNPCTFPWYGLTIFYDGKVVPCSQDYLGKILLGDLKKEDILTIWNNKNMQELRKHFADKNYSTYSPCMQCDRIWRKNFLGVPAEYIGTFLREAKIRK